MSIAFARADERSLEIWPNRYNSLAGTSRAARAADEPDQTKADYDQLLQVTGDGAERPRGRAPWERRG
jgi:hypothetical protein